MTEQPARTGSGPRPYRPQISIWWWVQKRSYLLFILRELTSVFVAWTVVFLLLLVYSASQGEDRYQRFLDWSASPWVVAVNCIALLFLVFHTVTWFSLTPQAMAVRVLGTRVPDAVILASQYVGWFAVSLFVLWLLVRG